MSTTLKIQNTYYDALFFASATINRKKEFHLIPTELRLLQKLIHYSSNQVNITWTSENISKHIFTSVDAIDKTIQRLKQKGYINVSTIQIFEKISQRTIFINWARIEAVNQLAVEYTNENFKSEIEETQNLETTIEFAPIPIEANPASTPEEIISEDDEPIFGVYPEQNNEYTKIFESAAKPSLDTIQFDFESMMKLLEIEPLLKETVDKKSNGENPTSDLLSGFYHYVVAKNTSFMEKYTAIYSNQNQLVYESN